MADVTIVCPTHGRAGEVTAFKTFGPDLLMLVAESQLPLYRDAYPDGRFDVHPDSVKGLIPKVRWMQERYAGGYFRVDDDASPMIDNTVDGSKVEPRVANAIVHRLADMAEQLGVYMFGFTKFARPVYYSGHQPFRLVVNDLMGGKTGFLPGHKIRWPESIDRFSFIDDIWACGMNAFYHRKALCDTRYAIPTMVGQKGGLAAHRTAGRIWEAAEFLRESFGDAIELPDRLTFDDTYPYDLRVPW